ncbi:MAG: DNA-directed RNA polymerase subunit beta' [Chloroflexi bacterium]|nr:DNA-directed RNA polymerase subunit beta' [Chloroflexota bacterium]
MEAKDFSALRISLASPEQIRSWSYGEVTKPETINYRRLRPEMDGLFCERIFGPTRDWQCYCGKYKNIRYRGIICDKCGVEVTRSSVRRERMGHIELAAPVAHVWYTRRVPSYLGLLLDVSRRNLDRVLYFAQYVVTTVDEDARSKAIARIEKELQAKEAELSGVIEDQMTALRDNRDQIAADFDSKAKAIRDHFDAELARLSDEVMSDAQSAQTSVENSLGQIAAEDIKLDSASAVVVAKGEAISNDHISKIQNLVNEHLSALQGEIEAVAKEEIAKISGDIDSANLDVDSSMEEQLGELDEKLKSLRASADKQIFELDKLQSLVAYSETATKTRNEQKKDSPFISESKYRELKGKFGNVFQASMGAEAFYEILSIINMTRMAEMLWDEVRHARSKQVRRKATKRLRVVESLRSSRATVIDKDETKQENEPDGNRPEWMILTVLPVIPPDLRPMVQLDGGRFATSDLNDLYRRVINRNNRLKHLLDLGAPDVIVRNEKRMLQEAVDSLIDNSQRGKALSRRGRRELKSLSDMLKGKKGRFRRNLLGKRVDYSGRSVIVIGPKLKLHQCGLPKTMALELYRPFVISRLVAYNYASNVKGAKRIIERERPEVWEVLEEVIRERPVLLNRAPTLHRLGIQAFEPLLVEGKAIQIHPLVCSAFNADFDGDQMAVHVPLSEQAVKEARDLMLSTRNLLKPSDGAPIVGPSKDMVLGNYYLTMDPSVEIVALRERADEFRTESSLYGGDYKVGIAFRSNGYYYAQFRHVPNSELFLDETAPDENGRPRVVKSAVDRTVEALLNGEVDCLLANAYEMRKYLRANDLEGRLEITNLHERRVVVDMDEVEYLYRIGLVNLHTPILLGNVYDELGPQDEPEICTVGRAIFNRILPDEMRFVQETQGKRGLQDLVARCYQVIGGERTTEVVDAIKNFGFHYATISGTTIAVSDLTIPDERAAILREAEDVVTRAERDFRRGLMTEEERYQITIDEWNRAKDYLQDQIQDTLDPYGPIAIMALSGSTKGGFGPITQLAGMRGLMADPSGRIIDLPIRSHFREGLNALEYFISTHGARKGLADTALRTADAGYLTRRLVDVAQDMIVNRWDCNTNRGLRISRSDDIAGQSVAERIVGRCAAEDIVDPDSGALIVGRNEMIDEDIAETIQQSSLAALEVRSPLTCDLVHGVCALCYGRDLGTGEMVNIGSAVGIIAAQSIGEPGTQLTLRTFHSGGTAEVRDITSGLPRVEELFEARRVPKGQAVTTGIAGVLRLTEREDGARIATVIDEVLLSEDYDIPEGWDVIAQDGKDIKKGAVVARNGDEEIVAGLAGRVHVEEAKVYIRDQDDNVEELEIPANARLRKNIFDGIQVAAGEQLTEGSKNPHDILRVLGANATQMYLLSEIQEVYRSQGVNIADKHFETVIRKMMCKVQITRSGDSDLLPGELIDQLKLLEINERLIAEEGEPSSGSPVLLGITKAALSTESYLSAASFQHTIKVLAGAAIEGQVDPLHGLKENVIIGKLIPAGTGFHAYHDRELIAPPVTLEAQGALDLNEVGDIDDFENMLSEL